MVAIEPLVKSIPGRRPPGSTSEMIPGRMTIPEKRKNQKRLETRSYMRLTLHAGGFEPRPDGWHSEERGIQHRPPADHDAQERAGDDDGAEHAQPDADRQGEREAGDDG